MNCRGTEYTLLTNTKKHYTGIKAHLKELTNLSKNKREKRKLQKFSSSHVDEKALSSISCVISFFPLNSPSSFFPPFFLEILFHIFDICVFPPALLWFFAHSLPLRRSRHFDFLVCGRERGLSYCETSCRPLNLCPVLFTHADATISNYRWRNCFRVK